MVVSIKESSQYFGIMIDVIITSLLTYEEKTLYLDLVYTVVQQLWNKNYYSPFRFVLQTHCI